MRNDFSLRSLLLLRQEDDFFKLLKKEKTFEVLVAFLYEVFDKRNEKAIKEDLFYTYWKRYLERESGTLIESGLQDISTDNMYRMIWSSKLITRKFEDDKVGGQVVVIVTNVYKDIVRLLEERTGNGVIGGAHYIEDDIRIMLDDAGMVSGDAKRYLKKLKEQRKEIDAKIKEIEKTGKMKSVSDDELRNIIHTTDRRLNSFGALLSRGTVQYKEQHEEIWNEIRDIVNPKEKMTKGEVAYKQLTALDELYHSDTAKAFNDMIQLFLNPEYARYIKQIVDTYYNNKASLRIMRNEGIDLRGRLRQCLEDSRQYSNQITLSFKNLESYLRSTNTERNRLLYSKSDDLLAACKLYGNEHSLKRHVFTYKNWMPKLVTPAKLVLGDLRERKNLIRKVPEQDIQVNTKEPRIMYRDIGMAGIQEKFRRLLDRHNGVFTLKDYVDEENTYFGMYEFLTVKKIISRYMDEKDIMQWQEEGNKYFVLKDYVSMQDDVVKEEGVFALNFMFNEKGYEEWKKDNFAI